MFLWTDVNQKSWRMFYLWVQEEKPSSYLKDNSIPTYLPLLFAVCLSKGCAVTSESAETAKLSLYNFLALIAAYKELELLPPIDKHQTYGFATGEWKCELTQSC